jgi:hypothetical protein
MHANEEQLQLQVSESGIDSGEVEIERMNVLSLSQRERDDVCVESSSSFPLRLQVPKPH